jgi:hypothetical protein
MKNLLKKVFSFFTGPSGPSDRKAFKSLAQTLADDDRSWEKAVHKSENGKRILIATSLGCYEHATIVESILAVALTLRRAKVEILLCDQAIPCCQMTKIFNVSPEKLLSLTNTPRCEACIKKGRAAFSPLGLKLIWLSQYLNQDNIDDAQRISAEKPVDQISKFEMNGMAVGEHAMAGALRFFARGDLSSEPFGEKILRRYFLASLLTAYALKALLECRAYDTAVFHHGIYVPQGIIGEACRKNDVNVVNWNPSYRKHTFIFSHGDSYHHTMITEPTGEWENLDLNSARERRLLEYLKSRRHGNKDWIWFHEKPYEDIDKIQGELGINFNKPCIGLLTSVMWDAQLHYASNAFKNMLQWVLETIRYFSKRPDLQLIIRIHPAEVNGLVPSRQKMFDEIANYIEHIPNNIFIVPPESHISTYALMEKCNTVIIYNTKTGIEISSMGIPVIVAGEAWIRNKGFSMDADNPAEYYKILDKLPLENKLSGEKLLLAKKYAYHFFFRRMIELPFIVTSQKHKFTTQLSDFNELKSGKFSGLDAICHGILNHRSFVHD